MDIVNLAYMEEFLVAYYFSMILVGIVNGIIWGCITRAINEGKGYDGGFAWGFWLGVIGLVVVLCRPRIQDTYTQLAYADDWSRPIPAGGWRCVCGKPHYDYETTCGCGRSKRNATFGQSTAEGAWTCSCGRHHGPQEKSCVCGKTKFSARAEQPAIAEAAPVEKPAEKPAEKPTAIKEEDSIALLQKYKALLDEGVITQEDYDTKKKQLLGL